MTNFPTWNVLGKLVKWLTSLLWNALRKLVQWLASLLWNALGKLVQFAAGGPMNFPVFFWMRESKIWFSQVLLLGRMANCNYAFLCLLMHSYAFSWFDTFCFSWFHAFIMVWAVNPFSFCKVTSWEMKMKVTHFAFIAQWRIKTSKLKWIHFTMKMKWVLPAGDPKMKVAKWIRIHFELRKWRCHNGNK